MWATIYFVDGTVTKVVRKPGVWEVEFDDGRPQGSYGANFTLDEIITRESGGKAVKRVERG